MSLKSSRQTDLSLEAWNAIRDNYLRLVHFKQGTEWLSSILQDCEYPLFGASAEGCWIDCANGIYITGRVIEIAIEYGLDVSGESEDTLSGLGEWSHDYLSYTVEPFLQNFAEEGFSFGYPPDWGLGWGLYRDEPEESEEEEEEEEDYDDEAQSALDGREMSSEEWLEIAKLCLSSPIIGRTLRLYQYCYCNHSGQWSKEYSLLSYWLPRRIKRHLNLTDYGYSRLMDCLTLSENFPNFGDESLSDILTVGGTN